MYRIGQVFKRNHDFANRSVYLQIIGCDEELELVRIIFLSHDFDDGDDVQWISLNELDENYQIVDSKQLFQKSTHCLFHKSNSNTENEEKGKEINPKLVSGMLINARKTLSDDSLSDWFIAKVTMVTAYAVQYVDIGGDSSSFFCANIKQVSMCDCVDEFTLICPWATRCSIGNLSSEELNCSSNFRFCSFERGAYIDYKSGAQTWETVEVIHVDRVAQFLMMKRKNGDILTVNNFAPNLQMCLRPYEYHDGSKCFCTFAPPGFYTSYPQKALISETERWRGFFFLYCLVTFIFTIYNYCSVSYLQTQWKETISHLQKEWNETVSSLLKTAPIVLNEQPKIIELLYLIVGMMVMEWILVICTRSVRAIVEFFKN